MKSMRSHLAFAELCREGSGLPERQARALSRPPPLLVASAVRRAVVSACEAVWPKGALLAAVQKLDVRAAEQRRNSDENRCPVYDLMHALRQIPHLDVRSQMETVRRILDILSQVSEQAGAAVLMPPVVHAGGLARCKEILKSLKQLDNSDLQRWKTHEMLTKFLDMLLHANTTDNPLATTLQASIRAAVEDSEFQELFLLRPEAVLSPKDSAGGVAAVDFATVTGNLNKYQLVQELRSDGKLLEGEAATTSAPRLQRSSTTCVMA